MQPLVSSFAGRGFCYPHITALETHQQILTALTRMLGNVRRQHSESVRADAAVAISELDHLLDPKGSINGATRVMRGDICPAIQLGLGIPKVRDTRLYVSEAKALFRSGQHHAAERAVQNAIERWGERP